jgi:hypothetical protein
MVSEAEKFKVENYNVVEETNTYTKILCRYNSYIKVVEKGLDLHTRREETILVGSQASSCLTHTYRKTTMIIIADDSYMLRQITIKMSKRIN